MPVGLGELHRRALVHLERRRDVHHRQRAHPPAEVARQAMRDAAAPIVADDMEAEIAERRHHFGHVEGHGALRIVGVPRHAARLRRIAVAAQVGAHHGVVARELRRDLVPHGVRLRITMQHQDRRAVAADLEIDHRAARAQATRLESREERAHGLTSFPCNASAPERPGTSPYTTSCLGSPVRGMSRVGTSS